MVNGNYIYVPWGNGSGWKNFGSVQQVSWKISGFFTSDSKEFAFAVNILK